MMDEQIKMPAWFATVVSSVLVILVAWIIISGNNSRKESGFQVEHLTVRAVGDPRVAKEFLVRMDRESGKAEVLSVDFAGHCSGWYEEDSADAQFKARQQKNAEDAKEAAELEKAASGNK